MTTHGRRTGLDRRVLLDPIYNGPERRSDIDRRNLEERRQHKRYRVKDFIFVKLCSKSGEDIGQLIDIGLGGLSFRYFASVEKQRDCFKLGIMKSDGGFAIDEIPFRIVSDAELDTVSSFGPTVFRRCSVRFGDLTPDQIFKLDYLLTSVHS